LALNDETFRGPVNVVSPNPVTNEVFTKTLGHVLSRPTALAMPAFAARLAFGEMADEMLLASQYVVPKRLMDAGYEFKYPELEGALRKYVG
jgi:NAD dependent epimerase/dehydratase family enzyme